MPPNDPTEPRTCIELIDGAPCGAQVTIKGVRCARCLGRHAARVRAENRSRTVGPRPLRTVGDCLTQLEAALMLVRNAGGDKIARGNAIRGIVESAHKIIAADTAKTAEAVDRLLEKYPQLASHLKAVK